MTDKAFLQKLSRLEVNIKADLIQLAKLDRQFAVMDYQISQSEAIIADIKANAQAIIKTIKKGELCSTYTD